MTVEMVEMALRMEIPGGYIAKQSLTVAVFTVLPSSSRYWPFGLIQV